MDGFGNIARNGTDRCIRSGSWQPENAIRRCEPELFAQRDATARANAEQQRAAEADAARNAAPPNTSAAAPTPVPVWHEIETEAYFPVNGVEITPEAQRDLSRVAERVRNADQASIRIVGYADTTGAEDSNLALSKRRADVVRAYLIRQGVPDGIIETAALGEENPAVDCSGRTDAALSACLQENRRSEVTVSVLESGDADTDSGSDEDDDDSSD
jgi:OOP family OmpA-OmpF porin